MESADAVPVCDPCDGCLVASVRSTATGDVVECVCGRRHEPRQRPSGMVDVRAAVPKRSAAPERPRRPPPRLIYVSPDGDAPVPPPTAIERAGAAARALRPDDPELVRVRRLLADLRPDCGDTTVPPPAESEEVTGAPVTIRDPSASCGGVPRGAAIFERSQSMVATGPALIDVLDALRDIAITSPDDAAVLHWLRESGTLEHGLRGLYFDVALAHPTAEQLTAWRDLGARREGAPAHGRRLVLRAAVAWEER